MKNYVPQIDQKLLSAFIAAAETGSFLQAGHRLNKSKSTISRWIKNLEDLLGYELFHKRANGSVLEINQNGKLLLPKTKSMMISSYRLEEFSFSLLKTDEPIIVRLAFNELISSEAVADISLKIKNIYPNIEINIVHADLYDVEDVLRSNRADFVLGLHTTEVAADLRASVVGDVQTMFIAHSQHRLANYSNINGLMLSAETMIYPSYLGNSGEDQYKRISVAEVMLVTDYTLSLALAEKGMGIAYVPDHLARPYLLSQRVIALDVNLNEFNNVHSLMLYCRESSADLDLSKLLTSSLKEWFGYC